MNSTQDVLQRLEARIGNFSSRPLVPAPRPLVLVVSGPSGVGKDAVLNTFQKANPDLHFIVTATTRKPRPGEVDGVDYHFVSEAQFETWIKEGQLLEHALVYGDYKGIPRPQVEAAIAAGKDVILRIDVQGAATVRSMLPGVVSVFLVAETEKSLVQRLIARKTDKLESLVKRVQTAKAELERAQEFDYVVVNADGAMERTVAHIQAILEAEKAKVRPHTK
ncbi:GUK1 [Auxenochlorella protothecoides x Auxenochlorella symbiontica]